MVTNAGQRITEVAAGVRPVDVSAQLADKGPVAGAQAQGRVPEEGEAVTGQRGTAGGKGAGALEVCEQRFVFSFDSVTFGSSNGLTPGRCPPPQSPPPSG